MPKSLNFWYNSRRKVPNFLRSRLRRSRILFVPYVGGRAPKLLIRKRVILARFGRSAKCKNFLARAFGASRLSLIQVTEAARKTSSFAFVSFWSFFSLSPRCCRIACDLVCVTGDCAGKSLVRARGFLGVSTVSDKPFLKP